ncbi:hypothetical protein [Terasakiella pusilla]|jgi:3-hydroxymyristoyl/3-hydroxydecanoyl-(acyl carrier protein) dehydratase|uniref:ApeI family dehydratase n=1 Tax=Terasakiella pusilla TaxID=64973 RepID=UPI003AA979DD
MSHWEESKILPDVTAVRESEGVVEIDLVCPADLMQFQGHFPEQKIMPGVGQLDWVAHFADKHFSHGLSVVEVSQLKYRDLMLPDVAVTLKMSFEAAKQRVRFSYEGEDKVYSSGIVKLGTFDV